MLKMMVMMMMKMITMMKVIIKNCSHLLSTYDVLVTVLKTFNSIHTRTHTNARADAHTLVLTRTLAGGSFIILLLQTKEISLRPCK